MASLRASLHRVLAADAVALEATLQLRAHPNATIEPRLSLPPSPSRGLTSFVRALLDGEHAHVYVVGGSAAAGAGGVGAEGTFGARLAKSLNASITLAEARSGKTAGRVILHNMAQGGTHSAWASMMAEELHGRRAHVLIWEYSINDYVLAQVPINRRIMVGPDRSSRVHRSLRRRRRWRRGRSTVCAGAERSGSARVTR